MPDSKTKALRNRLAKSSLKFKIEPKGLFAQASLASECQVCAGELFEVHHDKYSRSIATPCVCYVARLKIIRYNYSEIPARYYDADLDNFQTTGRPKARKALEVVLKKMEEFKTKKENSSKVRKGLLLYGRVGSGKTRLACSMLRALTLELRIPARFIEFTDLLSQIKRGYDTNRPESEFLTPLVEVDILVIDELGKGRKSDWENSILDQIISKRYFACKETIFTTNYLISPANNENSETEALTLPKRIDFRIYSRIFEMCDFVDMDMDDFRVSDIEMLDLDKS